MEMLKQGPLAVPIVYFDGVCGLCNKTVDFLMRHDKTKQLLFSPLQSELAAARLPHDPEKQLSTLVLEEDGRFYKRSDALLRITARLHPPYSHLLIFRFLPRPIRDLLYRLIATSRYRVWGKTEQCRVPTADERSRLLMSVRDLNVSLRNDI